jgi:hypothetical protein
MNQTIEHKIAEIKKMSAQRKAEGTVLHLSNPQPKDSLSMAIHSKKDADNFMAELRAINKSFKAE